MDGRLGGNGGGGERGGKNGRGEGDSIKRRGESVDGENKYGGKAS